MTLPMYLPRCYHYLFGFYELDLFFCQQMVYKCCNIWYWVVKSMWPLEIGLCTPEIRHRATSWRCRVSSRSGWAYLQSDDTKQYQNVVLVYHQLQYLSIMPRHLFFFSLFKIRTVSIRALSKTFWVIKPLITSLSKGGEYRVMRAYALNNHLEQQGVFLINKIRTQNGTGGSQKRGWIKQPFIDDFPRDSFQYSFKALSLYPIYKLTTFSYCGETSLTLERTFARRIHGIRMAWRRRLPAR